MRPTRPMPAATARARRPAPGPGRTRPPYRVLAAGAAAAAITVAVLAPGPAGAAALPHATQRFAPLSPLSSGTAGDRLSSVAAVPGSNGTDVWAVGYHASVGDPQMLFAKHWDGTKWTTSTTPNPDPGNTTYEALLGVAATSATNVWAVGGYVPLQTGNTLVPLAYHWDGTSWKQASIPLSSAGDGMQLTAVSAVSGKANDVWAVGGATSGVGYAGAVAEQWNGKTWKIVPTPNPPGSSAQALHGVAAVSASNVWAVGTYLNSVGVSAPFAEHWNGKTWKIVPMPNASGTGGITMAGVTAVPGSPNEVWAVGWTNQPSADINATAVAEQWNGKVWKIVPTPSEPAPQPSGPQNATSTELHGVTAVSANDVWAVGYGSYNPVIQTGSYPITWVLHWNGKAWKHVPSPNPGEIEAGGSDDQLFGAVAVSASNVWAVGMTLGGPLGAGLYPAGTLAEQWTGKKWKAVRN